MFGPPKVLKPSVPKPHGSRRPRFTLGPSEFLKPVMGPNDSKFVCFFLFFPGPGGGAKKRIILEREWRWRRRIRWSEEGNWWNDDGAMTKEGAMAMASSSPPPRSSLSNPPPPPPLVPMELHSINRDKLLKSLRHHLSLSSRALHGFVFLQVFYTPRL